MHCLACDECGLIVHSKTTVVAFHRLRRINVMLCSAGQQWDFHSPISSAGGCKPLLSRHHRSKADPSRQQNLLPLMLRPLRLVFSAQQVRKMRIVLLKATHAPLVACILGYERALKLVDRRTAGSSRVSTNRLSLNSSSSLRRPPSRKTLPAERRALFDGEARGTRGMLVPKQQPACESPEGLSIAIANLKAQVEILSDLLAKHKVAESA